MRIIDTVRLTNNQKRVIAKIKASPTPKVALEEISDDQNLIAARNMLVKLGLVEIVAGEVFLTDSGEQMAVDENIVDEAGELTQTGNELAHSTPAGKQDATMGTPGSPELPESVSIRSLLARRD